MSATIRFRNFIPRPNCWREFLRVRVIRHYVAFARFFYYVILKRKMRTFQTPDAAQNTVSHNMKSISNLSVERSLSLIRPLASISRVNAESKILTIGPRTEGEILNLLSFGFRRSNIKALDLISYSPWVLLGDMHQMPFSDEEFDVCLSGWVLAYSDNKKRAAEEMVRVSRNGAIVAIGVAYTPLTKQEIVNKVGYLPGSEERMRSLKDVLKWFGPHVGTIFFQQDVDEKNENTEFNLIVIFSIKK